MLNFLYAWLFAFLQFIYKLRGWKKFMWMNIFQLRSELKINSNFHLKTNHSKSSSMLDYFFQFGSKSIFYFIQAQIPNAAFMNML